MELRIRTWIYMLSGAFVLIGALLYITQWRYAPWLFAVGAAGVSVSYVFDLFVGGGGAWRISVRI